MKSQDFERRLTELGYEWRPANKRSPAGHWASPRSGRQPTCHQRGRPFCDRANQSVRYHPHRCEFIINCHACMVRRCFRYRAAKNESGVK